MSRDPLLALPQSLARQVEAAARAAYPEECCGLLVGRRQGGARLVQRVVPSANVASPPREARFEIDPTILLRAQREARESGAAVIGLYHSHPNGGPAPSDEDRQRAWQPDQVWLLLAVDADGTVECGAWLRASGPEALFTRMRIANDATEAAN